MITEKRRFFLFASTATREALSVLEQNELVDVVLSISRTSLAAQVCRACLDKDLYQRTGSAAGRLKFDFYKTAIARIPVTEFDFCILDMVDERFHLYELPERAHLTASPEILRALGNQKPIRTIRFDSGAYEKKWLTGLKKLVTVMRQHDKLHALWINRFWWASHDNNHQPLTNFDSQMIASMNQILQRRYDLIEMLLGPDIFLNYPRSSFLADVKHKWGPGPTNYSSTVAKLCAEQLSERGRASLESTEARLTLRHPGKLQVDIQTLCQREDVEFACYLYKNGECIEQVHYQTKPQFGFLRPHLGGEFSAQVFLRAASGAILVLDSTAKLQLEAVTVPAILGASLLHEQHYTLNGFATVNWPSPPDWNYDPLKNRTWRWNYLQLNVLPWLIAYDKDFQRHNGLNYAMQLIESWSRTFSAVKKHPEAWHDHCTAMRAGHLLTVYNYLQQSDGAAALQWSQFSATLIELLSFHAEKLSCEQFYNEATNHGFDQALSLGRIAEALPPSTEQQKYRQVARRRIVAELQHAFAPDGGHVENSPAYLNYGLKQALAALSVLHAEDPEDRDRLEHDVIEQIDRSILALAHMIKPDGTLPIIGDTLASSVKNFLKPYAQQFNHYKLFLYALSQGRQGCEDDDRLKTPELVLPISGYAIFRDAWQQRAQFERAVHIVMKCGFLSHYHRQDDDLHFVLMAKGVDWLIDGGLFNYHQQDPQRIHARSARAHNLSMPCAIDANREYGQVNTNLQSEVSCHRNGSAVSGVSNMFTGYTSTRRLDYARDDQQIYLHDKIIATSDVALEHIRERMGNAQPTYVSRFQVPGAFEIVETASAVEIHHRGHKLSITRVQAQNQLASTVKIYPAGERDQPESWYSRKLGRLEPCYVIEYQHFDETLDIQFVLTLP